jgi:hypothetical protein
VLVLIGADQAKLILGYSGSLAGINQETDTIAGSKTLEIPDLSVTGIRGALRGERSHSIAGAHGYAECYPIAADTYLETSGGGAGQLPRVLLFTAARSSL